MTTVVFTPTPDGRHSVRSAYDPAVVSLIKRAIPGYARSWSAASRAWFIDPDWAAVLAAELRCHGHTVTGAGDTRHKPHSDTDEWARLLFERVGTRRVSVVHRALTRVLHPDNRETGCQQLQRELNDARAEMTTTTTGRNTPS